MSDDDEDYYSRMHHIFLAARVGRIRVVPEVFDRFLNEFDERIMVSESFTNALIKHLTVHWHRTPSASYALPLYEEFGQRKSLLLRCILAKKKSIITFRRKKTAADLTFFDVPGVVRQFAVKLFENGEKGGGLRNLAAEISVLCSLRHGVDFIRESGLLFRLIDEFMGSMNFGGWGRFLRSLNPSLASTFYAPPLRIDEENLPFRVSPENGELLIHDPKDRVRVQTPIQVLENYIRAFELQFKSMPKHITVAEDIRVDLIRAVVFCQCVAMVASKPAPMFESIVEMCESAVPSYSGISIRSFTDFVRGRKP